MGCGFVRRNSPDIRLVRQTVDARTPRSVLLADPEKGAPSSRSPESPRDAATWPSQCGTPKGRFRHDREKGITGVLVRYRHCERPGRPTSVPFAPGTASVSDSKGSHSLRRLQNSGLSVDALGILHRILSRVVHEPLRRLYGVVGHVG